MAGRPAFLDPEATRPVARAIHRGRPVSALRSEQEAASYPSARMNLEQRAGILRQCGKLSMQAAVPAELDRALALCHQHRASKAALLIRAVLWSPSSKSVSFNKAVWCPPEQQGQLEAEVAAREATAAEPKPGDKRPAGWDVASMAPKQKVRTLSAHQRWRSRSLG